MLEIANQTEMSLEISWWIFSRSRSLRFDVRSPSPPPPSVRIFNGWKEVGSYEITALVDVFFATEDFVSFLRRRKRGWKPNDSGWGCWFVVVVLMDVFAINFWEVLWNVPSRLMDPLDSSKLGQRFPAEITQQYRFSAWESWYSSIPWFFWTKNRCWRHVKLQWPVSCYAMAARSDPGESTSRGKLETCKDSAKNNGIFSWKDAENAKYINASRIFWFKFKNIQQIVSLGTDVLLWFNVICRSSSPDKWRWQCMAVNGASNRNRLNWQRGSDSGLHHRQL